MTGRLPLDSESRGLLIECVRATSHHGTPQRNLLARPARTAAHFARRQFFQSGPSGSLLLRRERLSPRDGKLGRRSLLLRFGQSSPPQFLVVGARRRGVEPRPAVDTFPVKEIVGPFAAGTVVARHGFESFLVYRD